jgi:hypothetical protein
MRFRWPFLDRLLRQTVDESALAGARAELAMAETALVSARATYLRLQDAGNPTKLRLQQSALDLALDRYHAARRTMRTLEDRQAGAAPWSGSARRWAAGGSLSKE